ncbi:hypothetical protein Fmac_013752 [Flemingia macrophylla]|uniref:RING-type domain-containing protein n=1 Tax=Flemingia macrophylla TaxID=520843 RepID=A0ABD1MU06_9FABA
MGEGGRRRSGRGAWKLRNAASKVAVAACGWRNWNWKRVLHPIPISLSPTNPNSSFVSPSTTKNTSGEQREGTDCRIVTKIKDCDIQNKNLCAICLDPVSYNSKGSNPGQAIFTAQCSHAFHFACISSNVRHGNITCPICRAQWSQLPRNLNNKLFGDPILQILDDSIAIFRVHRSLFCAPPAMMMMTLLSLMMHMISQSLLQSPTMQTPYRIMCFSSNSNRSYVSLKLTQERATDLVLVASPNGPHLRLLKRAMALVVFSLRHIDRLAIVTYSSAAARVFPLRRMTSYGKRTALQVIECLFYMGQADPVEGLKKGIKILEERTHKNLKSCILNLSDSPTRPYHVINMELPSTPIHRFHVGLGFGTSKGFVRICRTREEVDSGRVIRIAEMRGGEERRVLLDLGDCTRVYVEYSYTEGDIDECIRTGESFVCVGDNKVSVTEVAEETMRDMSTVGRNSSVESWYFHDPYMARRWAKHFMVIDGLRVPSKRIFWQREMRTP